MRVDLYVNGTLVASAEREFVVEGAECRIDRIGISSDRVSIYCSLPSRTLKPLTEIEVLLIKSGHKIAAIKQIRQRTGAALRDAKDAADEVSLHPERF